MVWHDFIGAAGVTIIIVTYFLLQIGRIHSENVRYSLLNGIGASLILLSLLQEFNLSAFVVELFWVLISAAGLVRSILLKGARQQSQR